MTSPKLFCDPLIFDSKLVFFEKNYDVEAFAAETYNQEYEKESRKFHEGK